MLNILGILLPALLPIIQRVIPDPQKQAEAQLELTKVLTEQQNSLYDSMKEVMVADAQSDGVLTKNARPLTVIWSLFIITYLVIVCPAVGLTEVTIKAITSVPDMLWVLLTTGIGAYPVLKTVEGLFKGKK